MVVITNNMTEWLANGERGISSNTIFAHLTGIDAIGDSWSGHPNDPADWRRCELLLEQCPELRDEFDEMKCLSGVWAGLVGNWDKIKAMFIEEAPKNWRDPKACWNAPKTYDLMQEIIDSDR